MFVLVTGFQNALQARIYLMREVFIDIGIKFGTYLSFCFH